MTSLVILGGIVLMFRNPALLTEVERTYRRGVAQIPESSLGPIDPADLKFLQRAGVIAPQGERVLLPGIVTKNRFETWNFSLGSSRALPLYSNIHFAFFLGLGPTAASGPAYRKRVCENFDIPWLKDHEITWVFALEIEPGAGQLPVQLGRGPAGILRGEAPGGGPDTLSPPEKPAQRAVG